MLKFFLTKIFAAALAALFVFCIIYVLVIYHQLPAAEKLRSVNLQVPLRIYSADQKLMAEYGEKKRIPVKLNAIPPDLINAFLATEDANFYNHHGVDPRGLARAVLTLIHKGRKEQGGSTITMQVARNFFLSRNKTFSRKINEILLSFAIEHELSKNEILELYLNKIFLGQRAYGVAAAAQVYYGKNLTDLTLAEMAVIAGLPKAPSTLNPIVNPERALERRNHVLSRMRYYDFIDQSSYQIAMAAPLTSSLHYTEVEIEAPYVAEMVREIMDQKFGENAYTRGFKVITTIDSQAQQYANTALQETLNEYDKRHGFRGPIEIWQGNPRDLELEEWKKNLKKYPKAANKQVAAIVAVEKDGAAALLANGEAIYLYEKNIAWAYDKDHKNISALLKSGYVVYVSRDQNYKWILDQRPKIEGAFVATNPNNGDILALLGGYDYEYSQFNRATKTKRQTGSVFKTFIYSAALDHGYNPATLVNDAPIVIKDGDNNEDDWRPQNHTKSFDGLTSLRNALANSRNLVSIRILEDIGIAETSSHLKKFGFNPNDLPPSLSLALGASSATALDLARAYSVFANGGYLVSPTLIDKINDNEGRIVYERQHYGLSDNENQMVENNTDLMGARAPQRTISKENAYIISDILKDVIQKGTGQRAKILRRHDLAGKTGSTNDNVDAWFAGFNHEIVAVSWMGFDNAEGIKEYSATTALVMWIKYMRNALDHVPESSMPQPIEVVTVKINPENGEAANGDDDHAIDELFYKTNAPQIDQRILSQGSNKKKEIEDIF